MARSPKPPSPALPPAQAFREEILRAQIEGNDPADLVLRLTLGDMARLKRDRSVPLEDISYAGGEMRFLGVKVVAGDVPSSALEVATA